MPDFVKQTVMFLKPFEHAKYKMVTNFCKEQDLLAVNTNSITEFVLV